MAQIQPITKVFQPEEILEAAEMNMLVTKINELIQRGDGRLSSLSDVVLQNLQTGETLTWDGEQWTNARQIPLGQLGQVLYYDGDGWVALDASDLDVGKLGGYDADTFMGALEADYIQASQPQGALGKHWIDTANNKYYVYSVIGGGTWTELTRETAILRLPNILAYNRTTEAWYVKTSLGWNVIAGGGDVKAISVMAYVSILMLLDLSPCQIIRLLLVTLLRLGLRLKVISLLPLLLAMLLNLG